jgi:hypothetical protein
LAVDQPPLRAGLRIDDEIAQCDGSQLCSIVVEKREARMQLAVEQLSRRRSLRSRLITVQGNLRPARCASF